mmetsp:Transcript_34738/g.107278  ORF Transcript_34738/g.107278 Transcript_34738/m.107278 type:complete len:162 (-) Transcript_34738:115-600(-)
MLVHRITEPTMWAPSWPASAFRLNETLLVPWKMLALAVHATALFTVTDYRDQLVDLAVFENASESDRRLERDSMNFALALTYIAVIVSTFALVSARTISFGSVNFLSAVGHSVSGILLLLVWLNDAHWARIWHVFFVFTMVPGIVELAAVLRVWIDGTYMW